MPSLARPQLPILLTLCALGVLAVLQVAAAYSVPAVAAGGAAVLLCAVGLVLFVREPEPGARRPADVSNGAALVILALIVVAALAIRLHTLMDRPAWDDEMWTLRNMYTSDWGELFRVAFDDYWPPLHYVLLNGIARVADTGIFWLRLPSVIFGVAAVAVMYPLGLQLFGRRSLALVGSALLAGMTAHVVFSQEARVYAMQVLLVVASAYFFYRSYWERTISPAFLLTTTLLTYSHSFSSWYFIAGQCAYVVVAWLIWKDRRAFIKGALSQVLVVALWLPLVAAFAWARFRRDIVVPTYWATGEDDLPGVVDVIEQYQGLAVRSWAGAGFLTLLFALALWLTWRRLSSAGSRDPAPRQSMGYAQAVVFLLCWIIVPVAFSLAVSIGTSMKTFGAIRYHLSVVPALCLLGAAGFAALRSRAALAMAAAIVVLLPAAELPEYYREFGTFREAHDEAAALVRSRGQDDERIYVGNGYRAFGYYFKGIFPRIGSAQWDSLTAAHAHLTDVSTLYSPKWGDTYAYEKLSPRIAFYGYYPLEQDPRQRYRRFIDDELGRGGLRGTFWLVLDARGSEHFLPALEAAGIACRAPEIYEVRGLELRRCNPPGTMAPAPSAEPARPVTRLQKSEENAGSRMASSDSHAG